MDVSPEQIIETACSAFQSARVTPADLTKQEFKCLSWCKQGKTNWEIAEILAISEKTVEFHLGNTMKKLGVSNRMSVVLRAIKIGLIEL